MTRKAKILLPTYRYLEPGRDAYLMRDGFDYRDSSRARPDEPTMDSLLGDYSPNKMHIRWHDTPELIRPSFGSPNRFWMFNDQPSTIALPGNTFAKSLYKFHNHQTYEAFVQLLKECIELGVSRPSSYGSVVHALYKSPSIPHTFNLMFDGKAGGAWQEALVYGDFIGPYYLYDLVQAYLWALSLGLPNVESYSASRDAAQIKSKRDGIYVIRLANPVRTAPPPFNDYTVRGLYVATPEEIETYNLPVSEVVDGMNWDGLEDPQPILDAINVPTFRKEVSQIFWGMWRSMSELDYWANGECHKRRNRITNIPWAYTIISRVKLRLYPYAQNAVHVYVDGILSSRKIPTGDPKNLKPGDFQIKETYPVGVYVRGPGQYGDIRASELEKMAGIPIGSAQRQISLPVWKEVQIL